MKRAASEGAGGAAAELAAGAAGGAAMSALDGHDGHEAALRSGLAELRAADELVDCVLALGAGESAEVLPLHAAVAAACSGHLRGALRTSGAAHPDGGGGMDMGRWRGRDVRRVVLPVGDEIGQIPATGVRLLVNCWYSGRQQRLGGGDDAGVEAATALRRAADYLQAWREASGRSAGGAAAELAAGADGGAAMSALDGPDGHDAALRSGLAELRAADELVDCVLALGAGEDAEVLPLHAAVGAACSGHVRGALRATWAGAGGAGGGMGVWRGRVVRRVVLPVGPALGQIPAAGVRLLVDFWYSGQLDLGPGEAGVEAAEALWCAADYLQAWRGVAEACEAHVRGALSAATWVAVWALGERYGRPLLARAAVEYAARTTNFEEAVAHASWGRAPLGAVRQLLRLERLRVNSEDEVLAAALCWVKSAKGSADALAELLAVAVRLPHVSAKARASLRRRALVAAHPKCARLLDKASTWVPSSADRAGGRVWAPRGNQLLVVLGALRGGRRTARRSVPNPVVQVFDVETSCWTPLPALWGYEFCYAAAASLGDRVYLAGGNFRSEDRGGLFSLGGGVSSRGVKYLDIDKWGRIGGEGGGEGGGEDSGEDGGSSSSSTRDFEWGAWIAVAPMSTARRYAAAASLDGCLYVAGGMPDMCFDRRDGLSVVERYSPASDSWEEVASMTTARKSHQLVALGRFLYAIGGGLDSSSDRMATAERYNPTNDSWKPIASMARARSGFAAAAMSGLLYVAGGVSHDDASVSCERYDPATKKWQPIADIPDRNMVHEGVALACLGGRLYAAGGQKALWRYDAVANVWARKPKLSPLSAVMCPGFTHFAAL
jgi:hypothetical protein